MAETKLAIVTFTCLLLTALIKATSVNITQEWKRDFGWELVCHWVLDMDDSLQSVMLSKNKQLFFIFRPENLSGEIRKSNVFNLTDATMKVDCVAPVENGIKGKCKFTLEPHVAPKKDFTFGCGVSGERPYFKIAEKEVTVEAMVPPTEPIMIVTRQIGPASINCTTSGIPAPKIIWTVGNQTVPHDFHSSFWNATSKLWHVWSTFTPQTDSAGRVKCTPEITKGNQHIRGPSTQYNNAYRILLDGPLLMIAVLSSLFWR